MKILVINRISDGNSDALLFDLIRSFCVDGDEVVLRTTDGQTDALLFLYDADTFDRVVVYGEDAFVSLIAYYLADTAIPLIPIPTDSDNMLSLNLDIPSETHALVKLIRDGKFIDFDIGVVKFYDQEEFGFLLMVGAGLDASIVKLAEHQKKFVGTVAYLTSAIANSAPGRSQIHLEIDGKSVDTSGIGVLLMNFSRIQFDIKLLHDSRPIDGMLDIVVFNTNDAIGLLPALFDAILDSEGDHPDRSDSFQIHRGKNLTIEADPPLPVQIDGMPLVHNTPFSVCIKEKAARIVVSEQCEKSYIERTN